jgi:hypothetical protein
MAIYGTSHHHLEEEKDDNPGTDIRDMKVGETGYAVPWAVEFDHQGRAYLRLDYDVFNTPGGTVQMGVKRIGPGRGDYEIDLASTRNFYSGFGFEDKSFIWTRMDAKQIESIEYFAYIGSLDDAVDGIIRPKQGEDDNNIWVNHDSPYENDPNDIHNKVNISDDNEDYDKDSSGADKLAGARNALDECRHSLDKLMSSFKK